VNVLQCKRDVRNLLISLRHRDSREERHLIMARQQRRYPAPKRAMPAIGPEHEEAPRRELVYWLGALALIAFGAFVWNAYGGREAPRISPPSSAYKIAPPERSDAPDAAESRALDGMLEGRAGPETISPRAAPEAPLATGVAGTGVTPPGARPQVTAAPTFAANGPYVAQVAALQSQDAVTAAWTRLASRAPALFAGAQLDVERADLGQNGVYYRVRAGYFPDRENAGRFCDRIKAMGQDCIAVRR